VGAVLAAGLIWMFVSGDGQTTADARTSAAESAGLEPAEESTPTVPAPRLEIRRETPAVPDSASLREEAGKDDSEEERWVLLEDGSWIRDPETSWLSNKELLAWLEEQLPVQLREIEEAEADAAAADPEASVRGLQSYLREVLGKEWLELEEGLPLFPEELAGLNTYEQNAAMELFAKSIGSLRAIQKGRPVDYENTRSDVPETVPTKALLKEAFGLEELPEDSTLLQELRALRVQFLKSRIPLRGRMKLFDSAIHGAVYEGGFKDQAPVLLDPEIAVFSPDFAALQEQDRRLTEDYLRAVRSALAARGLLPEGQ